MPLPFTALARYIGNRLSRYESAPTPAFRSSTETGNYGERVAEVFLARHGYRILIRNYKTSRGEIDLVCRDGVTLVFVEVKTRSEVDIVPPSEAIDERKEEALRSAAESYLKLLKREGISYRFDSVEVKIKTGEVPVCNHIQAII